MSAAATGAVVERIPQACSGVTLSPNPYVCESRQVARLSPKRFTLARVKGKPIARWGRKASGLTRLKMGVR